MSLHKYSIVLLALLGVYSAVAMMKIKEISHSPMSEPQILL